MKRYAGEQRRKFPREKWRIPCALRIGEETRRGIILDLSPAGLFVQVSDAQDLLPPGSPVSVIFSIESGVIRLETVIARARKTHRALLTIQSNGYGLSIVRAPEVYFQFLLAVPSART